MSLFTGQGTKTSSGSIVIKTANAGTTGVSGFLMFSSGTTSSGSSGELRVGTSSKGPSASVLEMGPLRTEGWSRSLQARLPEQVLLQQQATLRATVVMCSLLEGRPQQMKLTRRLVALYRSLVECRPQSMEVTFTWPQESTVSTPMSLFTDRGTATQRVSVVRTANAGTAGVSGALTFSSGITSSASSGELRIGTGTAVGKGGSISITVGTGTTLAGGVLTEVEFQPPQQLRFRVGTCL